MRKKSIVLAMLCALVCMGLAACSSGGGAASSSASAAEPIELNKTVTTDNFELTLTGIEWTDELALQGTDSGIQMSAKDNEAETMLVVKGTFKNLGDSDYAPGVARVEITVNGNAEPRTGGTAPELALAPGETEDVFYFAFTTNEVKESFKNGTMTISFFNQKIDGAEVSSSGDPIATYTLEF